MKIVNGLVYGEDCTFAERDLYILDGRLSAADPGEGECVDAEGLMVLPGFVDIHTHGAVGHDFCDADPEGLRAIAEYEKSRGVTSFCPTSMTLDEERLAAVFSTAKDFVPTPETARVIGINMEGPFIAEAKKGAQNAAYIRDPDPEMFRRLNAAAGGTIRLVTLAPELPGAEAFIREIKGACEISLGHTAADYETASAAMAAGAHHVTHLFNAMQPFVHRAPGLVGAAAEREDVMAEVICDGLHIHPAMIRSIYRLFGADRMILISDSMEATGMPDGLYELGGQPVQKTGRRALLKDGTLAGSASDLFDCFRNAVSFGIPLEDAVKMVTRNPARSIHLEDRIGVIREGAAADLLLVDSDLNLVRVI